MQETPHGNFGIFPIVPKGKGGFHMEVGNARKWQAFFVDYLKINLWVLASLSTAKQKLEIRREDYGFNNSLVAFHFLTFPAAICPKSIFSFSACWRHAIGVSAKELLSRAFHSFLYSFLNGCILILLCICPYFALVSPQAFKHDPAVRALLY